MSGYFQFLLLGLGGGAIIAGLALGVVLEQRASGVVNFAHAAMGMYVAFVYFELRRSGDVVLPILGLPARLHVGDAPSTALALAVAALVAALLGLLVFALVFHPLRHAPPLARVVASIGLLLYLQEVAKLRFQQGAAVLALESLLPSGGVDVLGVAVQRDRLWLAAMVVATAGVLWALYRFTRFGLVTRAAAENERGALLLGLRTTAVGALNWVLAAVLAGAAMILAAPISGLSPISASLLIVPALAAAMVGGFASFTLATAAGLGIGMVQSVVLKVVVDVQPPSWLSGSGLQLAVPFLVVVAVMILRGRSLPDRGTVSALRFPTSPEPRRLLLWAGTGLAAGTLALLTLDSPWRQGIITTTIAAVVCLSIVVLTGYVGQISLAPMAFAGVAGFAVAKLQGDLGVPFPWAPMLAVVAAVAVGLLTGLPSVRVRGLNLAIATLAAAVAIEELVFRSSAFVGAIGAARVPPPSLFGLDLGIAARGADNFRPIFGIVALVVMIVVACAVANLRRSQTGMRWLAVRTNERAAAAAGVDVTRAKLGAFAFASLLASLGGVMLAYRYQTLSVETYTVFASLSLIALAYLGGIASVTGAIIASLLVPGGVLTVVLNQSGTGGTEYQLATSGVALVVLAVVYPSGISGAVARLGRRRPPDGAATRVVAPVGGGGSDSGGAP